MTCAAAAHILRQIINQDKSALARSTQREKERGASKRHPAPSPPSPHAAVVFSSAVRNDFLPSSLSFSSPASLSLCLEERRRGRAGEGREAEEERKEGDRKRGFLRGPLGN